MECYCCNCQPQVFSRNISTSIAIRILQNPIVRLVYLGEMSKVDHEVAALLRYKIAIVQYDME